MNRHADYTLNVAQETPENAKLKGKPVTSGLSRRCLLKVIAALSISPSLAAQTSPLPLAIRKLHLFGLRVSDMTRSLAFYQELFGAPVQARQGDTLCLRIGRGPQYFTLSPTRAGETPGISHIGLSVPDFNIDELVAQLGNHGFRMATSSPEGSSRLEAAMQTWVTTRSEGNRELFFADAEGLIFQLCSEQNCGGSGVAGDNCQSSEPSPTAGRLRLVDINHFTNYVSNSPRANQFYLNMFGLKIQSYQGPNSPTVGVGDGRQFLMYVGGNQESTPSQAGRIDHVSLSVENFNVEAILATLTDLGLSARENPALTPPLSHWISMRMPNRGGADGGTPELYFSDPDGLHIQLQHVDYCGGGGYLGDQCT